VRLHRQTLVLGALGAAAVVSLVGILKILTAHPEMYGIDLPAYVEAAKRLISTGTPYSQQLHLGQLDRYDIATGYLYPPPLAQLFVPLSGLPMPILAAAWAFGQAVILVVALTMVYVRFGGPSDRVHIMALFLGIVAFTPNLMAIIVGNVSGWIAIAIAVMLLGPAAARSGAAAATMWIKLTPGAFAIGALVDKASRWLAVLATVAILAVSFALSPSAWVDWIALFPSVSGFFADVPFTSNLAPSHVLTSTGFPWLGAIAAILVPAGFAVSLLRYAWQGQVAAWVAAGTGIYLSATGTSWDHYFVALSPIAIAAWPRASRAGRTLIVGVLGWFGPLRFLDTQPVYQLIGLGLWLTFLSVAIVGFGDRRSRARTHEFDPIDGNLTAQGAG
jgi:hypothetical protein